MTEFPDETENEIVVITLFDKHMNIQEILSNNLLQMTCTFPTLPSKSSGNPLLINGFRIIFNNS